MSWNFRDYGCSNRFLIRRIVLVLIAARATLAAAEAQQLLRLRGVSRSEGQGVTSTDESDSFVGNFTVPLHAHSGTHHVHVYIGSPAQRQTLIVDTGSRAMAFPCKPCRSCGEHASPYFDPALSTTQRISKCGNCVLEGISTCSLFGDHCEINQKYTEGSSWSAHELEDIVWLGTSNVVESLEDHMQLATIYAFGCQTSVKGLFQKQYADGILGLARHESSLVAAYFHANVIHRNAFSLCLTMDAGHLSLGGSMPRQYHREPMKMTPITREHGWYSVEVTQLLVGGIEVTSSENNLSLLQSINSGKGCILDSGTTDTYLPAKLAKRFAKAAMAATNGLTNFSDQLRQRSYSFAEFQILPQITFVLANNVTLTMEPRHYMEGITLDRGDLVDQWEGSKILTNRVYLEETDGAVLGANAMIGVDILFDLQGHQVGIAKADCTASLGSVPVS